MPTPRKNRHPGAALLATILASTAQADSFQLSSPDLGEPPTMQETFVFNGFGCQGQNLSPALDWTAPPAGTKSFAVTVYDPDAPTGSGWWHWVAFNLPGDARHLPTGASSQHEMPEGTVESRTDFGAPGYGGPCPPEGHGDHHYQFRIFALDVDHLELSKESPAALVGYMLNQHALGVAELETTYSR